MLKSKKIIAGIILFIFSITALMPLLHVSAQEPSSYKITVIYDDALCDVELKDWYTGNKVENGGYITEDATAKRAYLQIEILNISEGYRIKSVKENNFDVTEGFVEGAYGGIATTIFEDSVYEVEIEKIPDSLCKVMGGEIYIDRKLQEKVSTNIDFTENSRLYVKAQLNAEVEPYFSGCYFEYSTDKVNWIPCKEWGNRTDFWAGWSYHKFDFVNTKNYYMRAHLFGREYYSEGDVYTDIITINATEDEEQEDSFDNIVPDDIKIGEYIQLGTYNGEPIIWRSVYNDTNGTMFISDKQLSMKCYSGGTNQTVPGNDSTWGDSLWAVSDIRSWLNSSAGENEVDWLDGTKPDENASYRGYNAYHDEAGFLSQENFTDEEKNLIKKVHRKSYLALKDADRATTGTTYLTKSAIGGNLTNINMDFESLYAEYVTDRVFIPNIEELKKIYENRAVLGDTYYYALPTDAAKTQTECSYRDNWDIWVSQPVDDEASLNGTSICTLDSNGNIGWRATCGSDLTGIRPAFYLKDCVKIKSGSGTPEDPYVLTLVIPSCKVAIKENAENSEINVSLGSVEEGNLVILTLYKDGKLAEVQTETYKGEIVSFVTNKKFNKAKVMVWDSFATLKPLCVTEKEK